MRLWMLALPALSGCAGVLQTSLQVSEQDRICEDALELDCLSCASVSDGACVGGTVNLLPDSTARLIFTVEATGPYAGRYDVAVTDSLDYDADMLLSDAALTLDDAAAPVELVFGVPADGCGLGSVGITVTSDEDEADFTSASVTVSVTDAEGNLSIPCD